MDKSLHLKITSCVNCPYRIIEVHRDGTDNYVCKIVNRLDNELDEYDMIIPDWCPLPDFNPKFETV